MHPGQGPGLSLHVLGETGGTETVTLLESEIPSHSHSLFMVNGPPPVQSAIPTGRYLGPLRLGPASRPSFRTTTDGTLMAPPSVAGANQAHNNMMPYLTFYFCIALQGTFPSRG
jgi:microcystin-dependent protein